MFTLKDTGETMSYDQVRQYLMENPDIWLGAKEGKEVAMPQAEVQVEQYKPITKKDIEIGKFSKDEALDYYEDEKELDSGRMSTYISSMTVDVMDEDGNSIGNLIRLKDEDGIATYQATDIDGNELTLDEFDTKDEAIQALLDAHNKQAEKEFNKEQKRLAKEREKQAAKKQAQAPSGPVTAPALTEEQKAGEKEMDALQDGDSITTKNPIRLLKGIYGKRNADGTIRSAHTGVDGIFSSITEKIAKRYEGEEGMVVFEVPAGVTVEAIQIYRKKIGGDEGVSKLRPMETEAINNSKAQVVKLITFDSRGEEAQYIIKDPELRKIGYKPSEKAAEKPSAMPSNTNADIANRIRNKKQKGALSAIDFGISVTIYNGALDFMASQVDKGTKLGNAIANTIKWIDEKMAGAKWNKGAFGKYMNDTYSVTLPNGREVEVVRDDSKETAEVINGWYSDLEQKILDSKEEKLPAATWAKRLKSKEDEDLWTGLRDFLESKKPSEQVSKKELRDWMKDNRVEIVEVVKGEGYVVRDSKADKDIKEFDDYEDAVDFVLEERKKGNDYIVLEKDKSGSVKFEQYQLEGDKENYKEVLVTLPQKISIPDGKYIVYVDKGINDKREYVKGFDTTQEASKWIAENKSKYPSYSLDYEDRKIVLSIEEPEGTFRSSHYNEPNILVHLRMNTRTDANGKKVLFLEEVQSDWGQKGKKEGFDNKQLEAKRNELLDKMYALELEHQSYTKRTKVANTGNVSDYRLESTNEKRQKEIEAEVGKLDAEVKKINAQTGITPEAPFVTDTNAWTKLGLKVALKEAVKQGADKIAWTTGEQQNERYDLSKQVKRIDVEKVEEVPNLFFVDIKMPDGAEHNLEVENGKVRGKDRGFDSGFEGKPLEDIVGKDIAERILNGESQTIEGEGLKVGGKGMKGFYGSPSEGNLGIVGNVAKSLFKQEPGTVEISGIKGALTKDEAIVELTKNGNRVYTEDKGVEYRLYTVEDINEAKNYYIKGDEKQRTSTQSSIDITPEMRESVEKGLPLFGTKLSPEQELKSSFNKWREETGKMGIVVNWEKQAEADIKLFKALAE